jgi:1,4-dihydroxy-2-naphthoate octaprenyltransferase
MARLAHWVEAARPRTLSLAFSPVLAGASLAWGLAGRSNALALALAMFCALCIQTATNLFNDARDFERGGDGPDRIGPKRAVASGLLPARSIKGAAYGLFACAALGGAWLVWLGGWPILLLGLASIASGWAYSGGPRPISHTPLGELFVIAFFGLGAVCGTYWLCAGALTLASILAGLALGCFAAAVLMVNNIRDIKGDARVGRRTLAIVAGDAGARRIFSLLMAAPFALLLLLVQQAPHRHVWLAFAALPLALALTSRLRSAPVGPVFNIFLSGVAKVQAVFALLLAIGALW